MTKHQNYHLVGEDEKLPDQWPNWLESLRRNFDAEVHLPFDISREFMPAALLWVIDNKVDFGLFHEVDEIIIAHFGGDEIYLPSRWSDKRWHIGLEDKDPFDQAIEVETRGGFPPLVFAFRTSRSCRIGRPERL